ICWGHIERSKPKIKCLMQKAHPLTTERKPVDSANTEDESLTVHGEPSTLSSNDTNSLAYRSQPQSKPFTLALPPAIRRARISGKSASSIRSAASLELSGS